MIAKLASSSWLSSLLRCLAMLLILASMMSYSETKEAPEQGLPVAPETTSLETTSLISPSTLICVTYGTNQEIEAVRYDLEAAEFAFREFERGLSQFTPLTMDSSVSRDTRRYPPDSFPKTITDYDYRTRVGMRKEFFNGSSISGGVGYRGDDGYTREAGNPFVEGEYRFPLFSSYTTLRRITARTFEENEVFNARLDYVDTVRDTIQTAQERYFWLQVMLERFDLAREAHSYYAELLQQPVVNSRPAHRDQMEDEVKSVQSDVTKYEGDVESYRVLLQDSIGIIDLSLSQVERISLYADDHYGIAYLNRAPGLVISEAHQNDAEVRVLELARENSRLKKELAQKGKWDIFGNLSGSYDFEGDEDDEGYSGYEVFLGLEIRLIDPSFLKISLKRAQAEINKYTAQIRRRELELTNLIDRELSQAKSLKQQADDLQVSIDSRKKVLLQKQNAYLEDKDTIDNLISTRRDLYDTQLELTSVLGEFYEIITELDQATGIYFQELGISVENGQ